VFCWSAVPKIVQPDQFHANVLEYGIVGPDPALIVTAVLPWLELVLGILFLARVYLDSAYLTAAALTLGFTAIQSYALARGLEVACGCFTVGPDSGNIGSWTVMRTATLLLVAILGGVACRMSRASVLCTGDGSAVQGRDSVENIG
jgi:hypothetical protein